MVALAAWRIMLPGPGVVRAMLHSEPSGEGEVGQLVEMVKVLER